MAKRRPARRSHLEESSTCKTEASDVTAEGIEGNLVHIITGFLNYEETRVGANDGVRRKGTITRKTFETRKQFAQEFLQFLNYRYGQGAVARMMLADFTMQDVEAFNRLLVTVDYSSSQVNKRLRLVKAIIDRAGRPEHGSHLLSWNWMSRDVSHGKPAKRRKLPDTDSA